MTSLPVKLSPFTPDDLRDIQRSEFAFARTRSMIQLEVDEIIDHLPAAEDSDDEDTAFEYQEHQIRAELISAGSISSSDGISQTPEPTELNGDEKCEEVEVRDSFSDMEEPDIPGISLRDSDEPATERPSHSVVVEEAARASVLDHKEMEDVVIAVDDGYDSDASITTNTNPTLWHDVDEEWEDIEIRVEEDDFDDKKPPAEEFRSIHFFFRFVADRLRDRDVILKSTLPVYAEWKQQRKQKMGFKNTAVKSIDRALEACHQCVEMMLTIVRNSILLCRENEVVDAISMKFDPHDWYQADFADFQECSFQIGKYSSVAAWNLFSFATHGCVSKDWWDTALHSTHVGRTLMTAEPDVDSLELLGQTDPYRPAQIMVWNKVSFLSNMCISEYFEKHSRELGFGNELRWTTIREDFEDRGNAKYLNAFTRHIYILNPRVNDLAALVADRDNSGISRNKILAEPLVWLMYIVHFIIDRQKKLVNLVITTDGWKDTVTFTTSARVKKAVSDLHNTAKQELLKLNDIIAKLPSIEDLHETFQREITERDPRRQSLYGGGTPLDQDYFRLSNELESTGP